MSPYRCLASILFKNLHSISYAIIQIKYSHKLDEHSLEVIQRKGVILPLNTKYDQEKIQLFDACNFLFLWRLVCANTFYYDIFLCKICVEK